MKRSRAAGSKATTAPCCPTGCGKTVILRNCRGQGAAGRPRGIAHRGGAPSGRRQAAPRPDFPARPKSRAELSGQLAACSGRLGADRTSGRRLAQDYFGTIIIDEAHHAVSDSYGRILNHFDSAKVLGVTATPDRGDMRNLGSVFQSLAYEYSLTKAIREGYLVPIKALTVPLKMDLSGVGVQSGDFKPGDLDSALDPYLYQIADEMAKTCADRKTVVFLPLVKTSQKFRDIRIMRPCGAEVSNESPDREILAAFDRGRVFFCCANITGRDWESALVLTRSVTQWSSACFRKTCLDFLWHTERHELCRPAHLVCETAEVAESMTESAAEQGGPVDILEAAEQAESDVVQQREESLAKQLAEMKSRKRRLVDPLQFELSIQAEDLAGYTPAFGWEIAPPSEKQLGALEKWGI
ncbi:MAG: DEAD/DEAH box helicase, partial [Butyricicoccaceae bacterium]